MCVNADGTRCDHAATSRTPPARQSRPSPPTPHCRSSCSASRAPNSAPRAPVYTLLGSQRAICCQCWNGRRDDVYTTVGTSRRVGESHRESANDPTCIWFRSLLVLLLSVDSALLALPY